MDQKDKILYLIKKKLPIKDAIVKLGMSKQGLYDNAERVPLSDAFKKTVMDSLGINLDEVNLDAEDQDSYKEKYYQSLEEANALLRENADLLRKLLNLKDKPDDFKKND